MQPTADCPPPTADLTLDPAGVAAALGLPDAHHFLTRRRRLEAKGFPRPLPMTPLRWSRERVERWIADRAPPPSAAAEPPPRDPTVVRLENYRGRAA